MVERILSEMRAYINFRVSVPVGALEPLREDARYRALLKHAYLVKYAKACRAGACEVCDVIENIIEEI